MLKRKLSWRVPGIVLPLQQSVPERFEGWAIFSIVLDLNAAQEVLYGRIDCAHTVVVNARISVMSVTNPFMKNSPLSWSLCRGFLRISLLMGQQTHNCHY